jgi:protocatechuate 3,4-dioxygenase beta subunit
MDDGRLSRREVLQKCAAFGGLTIIPSLKLPEMLSVWEELEKEKRLPTPRCVLGPFYKRLAPDKSMLRSAGDPGIPLKVSGMVWDVRGEHVPSATVEIWQTDHLGHYDLDGYRYRAALHSEDSGKYSFDSVMPGHYPARVCQHIHYLVRAPGHKPLVTQLYFATDPVFEGDPDKNYSRDNLITSRELVRPVTLKGDPGELQAAVQFDVVLERL